MCGEALACLLVGVLGRMYMCYHLYPDVYSKCVRKTENPENKRKRRIFSFLSLFILLSAAILPYRTVSMFSGPNL